MVSTVDKSEVEKFSKISWDENGPLKPLFSMNSLRIPLIESTLDLKSKAKISILDIGCGGGFVSEALAIRLASFEGLDFEIVGLDPSVENIAVASSHLPDNLRDRVTYLPLAIEEYVAKYPDKKFDCVVMSEVIDHVDNPKEFVSISAGATKSGGSLIVTTPGKTIWSYLVMIVFIEYIAGFLPIGTHFYEKFVSPEETSEYLELSGCTVKEMRGSLYNPFFNTWRWVSFKHFMYAVLAIKN